MRTPQDNLTGLLWASEGDTGGVRAGIIAIAISPRVP